MNGHPRARTKIILSQGDAPIKICKSRWFPALIYVVTWSIMAGKSSTMKNMSILFFSLFRDLYIDPGVHGAIQEGPETIPEVINDQICIFVHFCYFFAAVDFWAPGGDLYLYLYL